MVLDIFLGSQNNSQMIFLTGSWCLNVFNLHHEKLVGCMAWMLQISLRLKLGTSIYRSNAFYLNPPPPIPDETMSLSEHLINVVNMSILVSNRAWSMNGMDNPTTHSINSYMTTSTSECKSDAISIEQKCYCHIIFFFILIFYFFC